MYSQKIKLCYDIFSQCFSFIPVQASVFCTKLDRSTFFFAYENGKPIGFAAVRDNIIELICILPAYQKKGHGTALLAQCESFIKQSGFGSAVLGRNETDLFRGAVINNLSHRFFEKSGYVAYNGCLDMVLYTEDFSYQTITERYPCPEKIRFIISDSCSDEIIAAVEQVEPKWVRHYISDKKSRLALALTDSVVAGFAAVDDDAQTIITYEGAKTGLIGYIGVLPAMRGKNIGTGLAAFSAEYLRKKGCTEVFIEYTSLDDWYSRLGFEDFLWFWLGEKEL